jgi:hypothetical protein
MIVSVACALNVLLALALALTCVISYYHKCCYKLWYHSLTTPETSFMTVTFF